jgi:hypothetical protein
MTTQLDLLQRDWCDNVSLAVSSFFSPGDVFTTDDLRPHVPPPEHVNWWGVAMARMKSLQLVERIGYATSQRPEANGRPVALWRVK